MFPVVDHVTLCVVLGCQLSPPFGDVILTVPI
jgi:hypothetical protein